MHMFHLDRFGIAVATLLVLGCSRGGSTKGGAVDSAGSERSTAELAAPEAPLFDLPLELTDQFGRTRSLESFRGHPTLIGMFYADCPYACPTLIADMRRLEAKLDAETRGDVRVLLVSFDPKSDTPERLQKLAYERKLDQKRWTLANASEDGVRDLAAALGMKYRRLDDGNYNHTSAIILIREDGTIAARVEGLDQDLDDLAARTTAIAHGS
jgi:protein SCO1/2